ncbi:hypothetical protein HDU82_009117 [Entophlyctis luteolus]|nr:hypothetical protein HDU82_009117 [Entophlyctis luteolus]
MPVDVNAFFLSITTAVIGVMYIPAVIYDDLLGQINNVIATRVSLVVYILAALAFYFPLFFTRPESPTLSPEYVQTYLVCFVVSVFAPMVLGGLRVAFANNAEGLRSDLVCPIKRPTIKAHHIMSVLGFIQEALELFSAGLKCAVESGWTVAFVDKGFLQVFGFLSGATSDSNVFRGVFWLCVFWVFVVRKYLTALNRKLGVDNKFLAWWAPTVSYDCPFYILVCEVMISCFRCRVALSDDTPMPGTVGIQFLGNLSPPIVCWQGEHVGLTVVAFTTMISYFPSGCSMCSAKDLITHEENDMRLVPAFVKFSQMIKGVCICSMVLFAETPAVAFGIASATMAIMFAVTMRFWPASSYGINTVKMFSYAGSMFLYLFLLSALYVQTVSVATCTITTVCGLILILVCAALYEIYVIAKHEREIQNTLSKAVAAFPIIGSNEVAVTGKSAEKVLRPIEAYTGYLLSTSPLQYRPAFLMLGEVELKATQMDVEKQGIILAALQQLLQRPRKHPALQEMRREASKVNDPQSIQARTVLAFDRLLASLTDAVESLKLPVFEGKA